jgi:hypothetical protein
MMAINFIPGEGAVGATGPVADDRVKKNARPHAAPASTVRRIPVSDDGRVARLSARVEALEALVEALAGRLRDLEAVVDAVDVPVDGRQNPVDASTPTSTIPSQVSTPVSTAPEPDRKTYQRQWARDRRAAKKAGLTLVAYRARQKAKQAGSVA